MNVLEKVAEWSDMRPLKHYRKTIDRINRLEPEMEALSDDALKAKTAEFKELLAGGKTVDDIKAEAFAVVREVSRRVLGLRPYDVQLLGGLVLLDGNIAEMATGEGKTLVASLPTYVRALEGKGAHVITVNDYLARRDRDFIGQIHEFLGLTVGLNVPDLDSEVKKQAYQADITYGISTEFGFDYLRDHMARTLDEKVQRPFHYAIIDEVDSILIDEAKTPLIIAGKASPSRSLHYICAKAVKMLADEKDYTIDRESKSVTLTESGIGKIESLFAIDNLFSPEHRTLNHYVTQSLRAKALFERDVDYIVSEGEIKLIAANTGRVMSGRSLSDGLHQAIEAKEGLKITDENKTQASITIQNYFRMYPVLAGMTGTAKTDQEELLKVYNMNVFPIPTNKPVIREDLPDLIFMTKEQKYTRIADEVARRHEQGQPILIGTTSIVQSETVAEYLERRGLAYQILNAKNVAREAQMIAVAGQAGQITIATNMAGRGTDIMLGEGVAELGGLCVIGTEKHESRRIDNQLRGRSGRQGDPGSTQFIYSIEDDLFLRYAHDQLEKKRDKLAHDEDGLIKNKDFPKFVASIQEVSEGMSYQTREYNLKLDNVINEQRKIIYTLRDRVLEGDRVLALLAEHIEPAADRLIELCCPDRSYSEDWKLDELSGRLNKLLIPDVVLDEYCDTWQDIKYSIALALEAEQQLVRAASGNEAAERAAQQGAVAAIDRYWMAHLDDMEHLKEGIGLRQYEQTDPVIVYQKEGFKLFKAMYDNMELAFGDLLKQVLQTETVQ